VATVRPAARDGTGGESQARTARGVRRVSRIAS
jgi:hypothetical protein